MAPLNNRVTVRRQVQGRDTAGQPVVGWVDVATVWADIKHETGYAAMRGDKPVSTVRASIKVRARDDFGAGMQVQQVNRPTKFKVSAVLPDERDRQYVFLVCEATQ